MLTEEQIERIAQHAFANPERPHRFVREKYGPPMDVDTSSDLERAIRDACRDPKTQTFERSDGGRIIRQPSTNLTVISDGEGGGTSYRDKRFERDFKAKLHEENKIRERRGIEPAQVSTVVQIQEREKLESRIERIKARTDKFKAKHTKERDDFEK